MAEGRVKWYSAGLGYGFILPDDGGAEVLVAHADVAGDDGSKSLEKGARVAYEVVRGEEGLEAKNVSGT